jgi:predicted amidohydrolase YtcJ
MGVSLDELAALRRAEAAGTLPLRVVVYLGGASTLAAYEGGPERPGPNGLLRVEGVKYYVDGALGSRGAALFDDYSDRPDHRGLLMQSEDVLAQQIAAAAERGFSVAVHAIGDRGNRVALAAIETGHARAASSREALPALRDARHRIEHVQVVHPEDFGRFARLGVIPSMQPTHCTSDMPWAPDRVGPDRIVGAYAWREFLDRGLILPLGSDFPVEEVSPLYGLYAAVTRQTIDGQPTGGWAPDQRLTREEAILGFTAWAAEAAGVPQWGRLRVGDRADLTVWDDNPMTVAPDKLLGLEVQYVVVEGIVRFPGDSPDTAAGR